MVLYKQKKTQDPKGNRILISITVLGSAGPIRFVVNEEEPVPSVIDTSLKAYAREGRRPVLGCDIDDFFLYCPSASSDALNPWETI
ncbi:putative carbohydrate esterase [Hibiscus syriacus]|uniref:Carbohydrate esterase n=1 Tax=Hibiscus syriacus TaxID=106335 RepID=A0A6A3B8L4_HIBSY|nr:putative carbohydrate esterase [Hibiscus syriacus]